MTHRVLVADDEPHIRLLILQTLEELEADGVEFSSAANGQQALDLIKAEHPRLVFLDVMMPLMSGFDVCRAVKRDLGFTDVHVVLLTAKGQEVDRQKGAEVGADVYMTKPFDPDDLLQRARQVLGL
jgi:two-component system, OmpR family, alkaline phosphatase synthesis response regulator PhoP